MDWNEFEAQLSRSIRGGKTRAVSDRALGDHFGPEKLERLQRLAERVRSVRSKRELLRGNIIFIPGIMGSELTVTEDGDADTVWVSFLKLIGGGITKLQLAQDGMREADSTLRVQPSGFDKDSYAETILWLKAYWNVEPFAYDWRKDLDQAAERLKDLVETKFKNQPVHLVAHSMGGLVSRNFIRLYPKVWKAMLEPKKVQGGRLIMLGTPNYGSYAIAQAMVAKDKLVKWLAAADLRHDLDEVLHVLNGFVGSYQLLPSPAKLPTQEQGLYDSRTWGRYPIVAAHLQRAKEFYALLDGAATIDPERMTYIAGCNQETLCAVKVSAPGLFEFDTTFKGDGRVTHALGLLPGVPTYYVDEIHGDLQKHEQVLDAIDEILRTGKTGALATEPVAARAVRALTSARARAVQDRQDAEQIRRIAQETKAEHSSVADRRRAEALLREAIMTQRPVRSRAVTDATATTSRTSTTQGSGQASIALHIEVVHGDIRDIKAPAVVAGHYRGVPPVRAVGALDQALEFWISKAVKRGIIGGGLGEVFLIPNTHKSLAANNVILAGMGEYGRFNREDVDLLFANVTYGVTALGWRTFATVVVGSGEGNLSLEQAIEGMLEGVASALRRIKGHGRLDTLQIVEYDKRRFQDVLTIVNKIKTGSDGSLTLKVSSRQLPKRVHPTPKTQPEMVDQMEGSRVTIERDRDLFRFSAITKEAVIPVREIPVQSSRAEGIADLLKESRSLKDQQKYGKLLHRYLMPEDFQGMIDMTPLTLIVDRSTAAFPWEMAAFERHGQIVSYGPGRQLTRQFRTTLSGAPGLVTASTSNRLRVLVIADPAPEADLQLPGAREEGRAVVKIFQSMKEKQQGLDITIEQRIGANECDPVELLALILSEEFDLIHYSGHGDFDERNPVKCGWVLGQDDMLSARDIFRARRVPRLIFANACFSGVIRSGQPFTKQESTRSLAGLAQAFFERGVQNYIGTGWPVDDVAALTFAECFYTKALSGAELGMALAEARTKILNQGSTWGAYQHYGQATAKLIVQSEKNSANDI
jgi:pimeloyl-ACP methyl ester carboxylesterase